ncbi:hypothetical protein [Anaerostipes sp. Marseille-Q3525]|uniref:hypothetical protein n=1 Tax=Anaerostipes sp. Marseille-Q3525 TaxID=2758418 RepID=UPI001BAA8A49|nr:hypothetical protein [Anaerostipes sp. Marseille-Q3525]MBR9961255.1 hypothetical protein [Anaerostipes sp. Marseille-Q3525]
MLKRETKATIIKALQDRGISEKYLLDQVDEYMGYYDSLGEINGKLKKGFKIDLSKEKRQITKEMRSILDFLGLRPVEIDKDDIFEEL